jgi:hypothetical protein
MTSFPLVQDVLTYLLDTGWQCHPETWNGASIWSNADRREVLVPASDDLGDTALRMAEILSVLTAAENRPAIDIITEINRPFDDIQLYRTITDEDFLYLPAAMHALSSVQDLITAAARSLISGPAPVVAGGVPRPAEELLRQVRLETSGGAGHGVTVRIPVALQEESVGLQPSAPPLWGDLGRQVGRQLHGAVVAARSAAEQVTAIGDADVFDGSVMAGVSANLCDALSGLSGGDQARPFEITFRWGRAVPSGVPAETVRFPASAAPAIRAGAARLRGLADPEPRGAVSGTGTVIGLVESLHGPAPHGGWRIRIHGDLRSDAGISGTRRVLTDLSDPEAYDRAMAAHRSQQSVQASGELSGTPKRIQLTVRNDDFENLGGNG